MLMTTSMRPSSANERSTTVADRRGVGDVEHLGAERLGVLLDEVADLGGVADGADDAVAPLEELLGQLAAEAAADAGDEPGALCHRDPFAPWRAQAAVTSSTTRRPLSVRG